MVNTNSDKIWISTISNGFLFEDASGAGANNTLDSWISNGELNAQGFLEVTQNSDAIDMDDRLEKLKHLIASIIYE